MRLFDNLKEGTYATQANAIKKIEKVLGEALEEHVWFIGVTSEGRFYPVVCGNRKGNPYLHLAGCLCVVG